MKIPLVDLKAQYLSIDSEIKEAVSRVIENSSFILGEEVKQFELEFAKYTGAKFAVGVGSGTDAIHLALKALDISTKHEVITVPNSFVATALAICYVGARPTFVDVNPETSTIDTARIEEAITKNTKAIIPVHLYGHPADMYPILELAKKYDLKVVEDACQAHGAEYKGKRVGTIGDVGCFSFYPSKNLGAYGDGGMVVTDNKEVAKKLRMLRNCGESVKYHHEIKGINSRLDNIQAAILRVKLRRLDKWNNNRRTSALAYNEFLKNVNIITPTEKNYAKHVFHLYAVHTPKRDELLSHLKSNGISASIHYPIPIHLQKAFSDLNHRTGAFPIAEKLANETISLPMFPELTIEELEYVVSKINTFYKNG